MPLLEASLAMREQWVHTTATCLRWRNGTAKSAAAWPRPADLDKYYRLQSFRQV